MNDINDLIDYFASRMQLDRDTLLKSKCEECYSARVVIINHFIRLGVPEKCIAKSMGLSQQVVNRAKQINDYFHHRYLSKYYSVFLYDYLHK